VSIVAADSLVYVGDAKTFEVRTYTTSGDLTRILRAAEPPAAITDDSWRAAIAATIPSRVPVDERNAEIAAAMSRPRPEAFPAYISVRVDPAGRIWIRRYEDSHAWTVFDAAGKLLGTVRLPEYSGGPVNIAALGADNIVLLRRDSSGAAILSFFHLNFPEA
jgi:hypothetical protein